MQDPTKTVRFSRADISDRQTSELIGLSRGLLADGHLCDAEVEFLFKWLAASDAATSNPVLSVLFKRLDTIMADGVIDDDERADLVSTLNSLCGEHFEVGEVLKPSSLPLCSPPPSINFEGQRFTFTGTFSFGSRRDCEDAVKSRGGTTGPISGKTDSLVIGEYATDAWKQSSWGRKIEKAVDLRAKGKNIAIVSEVHWRSFL